MTAQYQEQSTTWAARAAGKPRNAESGEATAEQEHHSCTHTVVLLDLPQRNDVVGNDRCMAVCLCHFCRRILCLFQVCDNEINDGELYTCLTCAQSHCFQHAVKHKESTSPPHYNAILPFAHTYLYVISFYCEILLQLLRMYDTIGEFATLG
jgi:hypothetical protein